uniref:Mce/MlaD domain-containing protein n=1 Tax=Inkyuleea mariana TaxID=123988 RepID=A0A4D6X0X9_9FLOR|nr:hypothetical protein [Inkyuleea mariana]
MNKIKSNTTWENFKNIIALIAFILFTIIIWLLISIKKKQGYSLFIEFSNAYGIKAGTSVTMRGINIGYIKNIKINLHSVLVLVNIKSNKILIPKNSIIETNQTGLFNDTVIDIIPLEQIDEYEIKKIDIFNANCLASKLLCNGHYVKGARGLNYDDLVRAATRISQRFDDPRFFSLFYIFLQNSIEISDEMILITIDIANITSLLYYSLNNFLLKNI